ncbi:unnamed protein product [Arctogadus glacialis]
MSVVVFNKDLDWPGLSAWPSRTQTTLKKQQVLLKVLTHRNPRYQPQGYHPLVGLMPSSSLQPRGASFTAYALSRHICPGRLKH